MSRAVHQIERDSFLELRSLVDLGHLPPLSRAVTERVIHASGDIAYAEDLLLDESALERAHIAILEGAPIATDVRMVSSGITSVTTHCALDHADPDGVPTRTASGTRTLAEQLGDRTVWVVGCAPTAVRALLEGPFDPTLVIGLPVGFIDAAESKAALAASSLSFVTNVGPKGGSAVAAGALNALLYLEED